MYFLVWELVDTSRRYPKLPSWHFFLFSQLFAWRLLVSSQVKRPITGGNYKITSFCKNNKQTNLQAWVVRKVDDAIHRINHYPVDSVVCFVDTYRVNSDLSIGFITTGARALRTLSQLLLSLSYLKLHIFLEIHELVFFLKKFLLHTGWVKQFWLEGLYSLKIRRVHLNHRHVIWLVTTGLACSHATMGNAIKS